MIKFEGLRKCWLFLFYREKYISLRLSGECFRCGECCKKILGFIRCPFLNGNLCKLGDKRPLYCKLAPISLEEEYLSLRNPNCGYLWHKK